MRHKIKRRFSNRDAPNEAIVPRLVRIEQYGDSIASRNRKITLVDKCHGFIDCVYELKALRLQSLWINAKCERKSRKWQHAYESFLHSKKITWNTCQIDKLIRWNFITCDLRKNKPNQ